MKNNLKKYSLVAILILAVGWGFYIFGSNVQPDGNDLSESYEILGQEHVQPGAVGLEYNSNPPTSGPHYTQTASSGYREEEIPDQHIIHNLEHGEIWISYKPSVSDEIKEQLKQFERSKIIITPREANDTDIAVAAWGRLDKFDLENDELPVQRIEDFIKRYINQGPEKIPGSSHGV